MPLVTGEWRYSTPQDLLQTIEILSKTRGVVDIRILKGRVVFQTQPWAKPDLLPEPLDAPTWAEKLGQIDLRAYKAKSLLEGVIFGWTEFRKLRRYATHICVWDHQILYAELFPDAAWPHEQGYFDTLYGLTIVEMRAEVAYTKGTVILCGGSVIDGGLENLDTGLVIRRGE